MNKITWCKSQDKGIKLIEPNDNLSKEYFRSAEESMRVLIAIHKTQSKVWLATTKYYVEYFAFYSILMKLGIKCEIHECTIELARLLEKEQLVPAGTADTLKKDKQLRIDNQYYLKNRPVKIVPEQLSEFLLDIKDTLMKLTDQDINRIRNKISQSRTL